MPTKTAGPTAIPSSEAFRQRYISTWLYIAEVSMMFILFRSVPHQSATNQTMQSPDDYPFVEQPSEDFFCPVLFGLLLQPHLTSCCGKHLSQEAATRIQGEGGACPLCKMPRWTTMLSKHFQRQVNQHRVFCHHEDRGCGWQGELSDLERHVQSCPMRDQPLMTDLLKLPL